MKRLDMMFAVAFLTAMCMTSCVSERLPDQFSYSERAHVDSVVRACRDIDSLAALAGRFAAEGNILGEVAAYRELGRSYRNAARYEEAVQVHKKGLGLAKRMEDTLQVVQALNNIGTAYRRMGVLEEAASWHYKGLSWCEKWSDTSSVALKNKVVSLNGLGNVHLSMGNDSLAMASFREALKGETRLGSTLGMAINYANIGALLEGWGQLDSARYYYGLSLESNVKAGSELGIALCHNHFGRLAEKQDDLGAAYDEYKRAYDVLSTGSDKWHWLESCTSLARVQMRQGKMRPAGLYLEKARSVAESLGSDAHLSDIYHLHYQISEASGDYKGALVWLEKYSECMSRLYAERKNDAIFELRSVYEREKNLNELRTMQNAHLQKVRRDRLVLVSVIIILVLAFLAIVFLIYSLHLRSRNNRILKELDKTKSNYFTNVAHEFRTPLTIIFSAARSIRDNAYEEGLKEDATDILRHSAGLLELVNHVLDVAKMTSGIAPDPVWRKGNLVSFVSGICERNFRYAEGLGIRLEYEYPEDSLEMDFVPDQVMRIVQNLLSNALKFSPKGSRVKLSLERMSVRGAEQVRIRVADEGPGMTKAQQDEIFRPFYQADGMMRDMGSGIGLSVVRLACEALGGGSHGHKRAWCRCRIHSHTASAA